MYSFGIVMLEIITGQPVIDHKRGEDINLQDWVCNASTFSMFFLNVTFAASNVQSFAGATEI